VKGMRHFSALRIGGLGLAITLLVTACGGTTPSTGGGSVTHGTYLSVTHGTYLVGAPYPETGSEADGGTGMFKGEQLAATQINKSGGVLGHKIVLSGLDDACTPQTAVNAANDLVSQGVQAIVGNYCSSAAEPQLPIFARANGGKGIPNIICAANSTTLTQGGYHNVFLINPSGNIQAGEAAGFFTKVLKTKTLLVADDQSTYAVDVAHLTVSDLKSSSTKVLPIESVPDTTQDFSPIIITLQTDHATAVYWTGYYAQAALFVRQLRAAGVNIPFVTADGGVDPAFISAAGSVANGTYATMSTVTQFLTGPAAKAFRHDYVSTFHSQPGPYAAHGYDGVYTLAKAAEKAHSLNPVKVIAALRSLTFKGLTGTVSFAADGARKGAKFIVLEVAKSQYELAPRQP